jgi:pimeloyl-ACP methyl ester carboxylesterase
MLRSSLVRRLLGLLFGLALVALPQASGTARAADKFSKVTFDTVDGVTLQGTFYPSPKGKDAPTVLLLHKIGSDSHKDGWDDLAKSLNEAGYSVLGFDFRGHGASTTVDPNKFWNYAWNAKASKTGSMEKGKLKESISDKGFSASYYPYLINDIAAAKLFLDDRNDASDCNSHALIVIGAEDGAALGALWMAADWNRYSADKVILDPRGPRFPALISGVSKDSEGKDQYCAIWLSMTPNLGGKVGVGGPVRTALRLAGSDKKIPMGFLFGQDDKEGEEHAKEFLKAARGNTDPDKLPFTAMKGIQSSKLTGSALLRKGLGTDQFILTYLEKTREKKPSNKWSKVDWDHTAYVWSFPNAGRPIPAKEEKGKALEPFPLAAIGITNQ